MKKAVITSAAPSAIGPYSQAIKVGNLIYTSGQIPIDPARSAVAVKSLPKGALIEIEVVAEV